MSWEQAYATVKPYVFRIQTPDGSGTGFLFGFNKNRTVFGIATAAHVIDQQRIPTTAAADDDVRRGTPTRWWSR